MDYNNLIRSVSGIVTKIVTPYKATVQFSYNGFEDQALLKKEKFIYDGHFCKNEDLSLFGILQIGSHIRFTAHSYDPKNPPPWAENGHNWYIINAWCIEDEENLLVRYIPGIVNATVTVANLENKRQGTLMFKDESLAKENILFIGSKVFLYGHRLNTKQSLETQLSLEDELFCDAIPCDPGENESNCSWFATVVWRGLKPCSPNSDAKINEYGPTTAEALLRVIRANVNNAKAVFVRGQGQVMSVLNEEFGLALLHLRPNQWSSVIFHRSACFLQGISISRLSLFKTLKEGDLVRMVCVSTQGKLPVQFIACQLSIDIKSEPLVASTNHHARAGDRVTPHTD